ncbi:coiled-coil-helix-coiled-coil-helix domain-containing protein 1 [Corythoichthys intestinalis]|uniref:coiled-coil-helix-coiled-coil-helix domain-containing protein 1 n=1 Tax=Corythoichthys intestinalis TaxID=161448 RepID=UPI0025A6515A|nr:coiled-coil-helix-coiled-coil-helix domain-containing protein 1 [Corythoichthys intestinalis]XP_061793890.1 coiled-coil-helix-coiled-coil-helix domain-containing protein 1 [Nerophis lumbriciformis]
MAVQGGQFFQEKVSRLLSKKNGKPVLKPNKPLVLRDQVSSRKPKKGEATCITELSVMMTCWKQNNFVESLCSKEMDDFSSCIKKAQASNKTDATLQGGRLQPKQANTLLKRYPTHRFEI